MDWSKSTVHIAVLVPLTVVALGMIRNIFQGHAGRKAHPLPPGPTPLPFVGSVLSINTQRPWLTYTEWGAKYGDIIYVRLLDNDIVVLNSVSVAADLLEKRSRIYSDRPFISTAMAYGHDCNFGLVGYGHYWRLCRRIFQQTFHASAAITFRPMQLRRARQLVVNLIDNPEEYPSHFSTLATATAMSATYDYEPSPRDDPMVSIVHNFLRASLPGLAPGKALLVKAFPFLLQIPEWLPGSWITREARVAYEWRNRLVNTPYQYVQERVQSGDQMSTSMVSDHITRMEKLDGSYRYEYEDALKNVAATVYFASSDSTCSVLMVFTLAMVEHPHVWKRAQEAIDAVVGTDRLPDFDDRASLPYIDAIIREVFRWRPITPGGIPHAVTDSDFYQGYYIPKGATVLVNVWAMTHDEVRYPNADKFVPERFLDTKGALTDDDPRETVFGFGRRKCPGRHAADASVWSAVVTMLATLEFNLAKDAEGQDILFEATFTGGFVDHPNPFPCRLSARKHVHKEMLDRVFAR